MAVPKRRHSKARTSTRRSQWKISAVQTRLCPQCHEPRLPHRACPNCGTYQGREVIQVETN
ncbi:MAG: 50S ribosomal protein L32 [Firmicutes bacterium]|nr:50S ribosomal protein L32 [Bacillota bacterium]